MIHRELCRCGLKWLETYSHSFILVLRWHNSLSKLKNYICAAQKNWITRQEMPKLSHWCFPYQRQNVHDRNMTVFVVCWAADFTGCACKTRLALSFPSVGFWRGGRLFLHEYQTEECSAVGCSHCKQLHTPPTKIPSSSSIWSSYMGKS